MMRWWPRSTARKPKAEKACIRNAFLARKKRKRGRSVGRGAEKEKRTPLRNGPNLGLEKGATLPTKLIISENRVFR